MMVQVAYFGIPNCHDHYPCMSTVLMLAWSYQCVCAGAEFLNMEPRLKCVILFSRDWAYEFAQFLSGCGRPL